jgi:ATP adenylyltransferase
MSVTHLWAPWRLEFIKGNPPQGCVFCTLPAANDDRESLIVHRGKTCFVILNKFPYNNGHLMVVPFEHTNVFQNLTPEVLTEIQTLSQLCLRVLSERYQPQGFNLGMNLGEAAGAGIKGHLHQHIVPRWTGDTNFMPVLAETRCLPQHLLACYDDLVPLFQKATPQ